MGVREYGIVDPQKERIFVYCLEKVEVEAYFHDIIKANIYDNLRIDLSEIARLLANN